MSSKTPSTQRSPRPRLTASGQRLDDLFEALGGGRDGQPHLLDLVVVLDQPQLGQEAGQLEIGRKPLHRFGFGDLDRLTLGGLPDLGRRVSLGLGPGLVDQVGQALVRVPDDP